MRRIFAILIIIVVAFLIVYGLVPPVKAAVDSFFIDFVGPGAYDAINGAYLSVVNSIGVAGFAGIVLSFGFVIGIVVHLLWVKADWSIRRWGASRTASDLGVTPVTPISTTPSTATTRPSPVVAPTVTVPVEQKQESETA